MHVYVVTTRVLIHHFSLKLEVPGRHERMENVCECWFVKLGVLGTLRKRGKGRGLVNKYGKVCYTNLLTQAQVLYTNFDFQQSVVSIYDTRASWSAPESKNSSDLEFVARASFEVGEINSPLTCT